MRLTVALVAAALLHGALFGGALVLLPRTPARPPAMAIDIDVVPVVPPRPDPPAALPADASQTVRAAPHPRRSHAPRPAVAALPPAITSPGEPVIAPHPAVAPAAPRPTISPGTGTEALVSAQPRYRANPPPLYPVASRRRREEGVVLVKVAVGADGAATEVAIHRSCGHAMLDEAALEAVRRWTFEPARAAGAPVASLVVIPVRFSLADADR